MSRARKAMALVELVVLFCIGCLTTCCYWVFNRQAPDWLIAWGRAFERRYPELNDEPTGGGADNA